ncbi:histidinol-phosphate transaminase [Leifsonia sp. AG29]|uniref:histidinol-phosphate transaminase n=1 Tax=Leifsonia sp. AG29 TaxID=2598860 RepID=UPI001E520900|nr:histidinol-phosphate transaminase [Leifsonia sp. AG29]
MTSDDASGVRLRPEIEAVPAYRQGRPAPADGFKLSSNENPYPPLPSVVEAVTATLRGLNRYPDATGADLRARLAERHGVGIDQVHLGSGSVALLAQLISAAAHRGDEVVYSWRSFEAYPGLVTVAGATSVPVPNRPDGGHDLLAMADALTERTRVVIVCSPNNPTGPIVTAAEFEQFMTQVPPEILVLLDEAYYEFVTVDGAVDGIPLLHRYPNLVVLRTFSKAYGLAALRIGYAVGPARVLNAARSAAIPLSVTDASRVAALASIDAEDELMERVARVAMRRDRLRDALIEQGWNVPQAQGNFVWLATGEQTEAANDAFFDAGLTVRAFPPEGIRISVGEEESVEKLLAVAGDVVRNLPNGHPGKRLG